MTRIFDPDEIISGLTRILCDAGVRQETAAHYARGMVHDVLHGQRLQLADVGTLQVTADGSIEIDDRISSTGWSGHGDVSRATAGHGQDVVFSVLDEASIRDLIEDGWDRLTAESYLVCAITGVH